MNTIAYLLVASCLVSGVISSTLYAVGSGTIFSSTINNAGSLKERTAQARLAASSANTHSENAQSYIAHRYMAACVAQGSSFRSSSQLTCGITQSKFLTIKPLGEKGESIAFHIDEVRPLALNPGRNPAELTQVNETLRKSIMLVPKSSLSFFKGELTAMATVTERNLAHVSLQAQKEFQQSCQDKTFKISPGAALELGSHNLMDWKGRASSLKCGVVAFQQ